MSSKYELQKAIRDSSIELSDLYMQENNSDLAEKLILIANFITPNQIDVLVKACGFYHRIRNFEKASYFADLANKVSNFSDVDCLLNSAIVSADTGDCEKAIKLFNLALDLEPNCDRARFGLSVEYLKKREMSKGWSNYMSRHKCFDIKKDNKKFHMLPDWDGKQHGNIVFYNEQGYGDFIFGLRYLNFVSEKYQIAADKNFKKLLEKTSLCKNLKYQRQHFKCSILDLPAILQKNEYYADSYKQIFKQHKSKMRKKKKIGLVFSGSGSYAGDNNRSILLSKFKNLLEFSSCDFFHINKNYKVSKFYDCDWGSDKYIHKMNSFGDTLEILYDIDALVTVDTGLAHLAGAIGMPTFVLLSKYPDFRWWADSKQTNWYTSWQIIKQKELDDWDYPIIELKKILSKFVTHPH